MDEELIKTNMTVSSIGGGDPIGAKGVASMKLTIGSNTLDFSVNPEATKNINEPKSINYSKFCQSFLCKYNVLDNHLPSLFFPALALFP